METYEGLKAIRIDLVNALARVDELLQAVPRDAEGAELNVLALERTKAIEAVLAQNGGVMRPIEIWAELQRLGRRCDPKMEVQVTTFDLWQRGRIEKLGRGQYKAKTDAQLRQPAANTSV